MLACEQGNDELVAVELARMLAAYPAQKTDDVSAELRMEAYFEALAGVPAWIVAEARLACLRGEGGCDPRFAPTPSQLSGICRDRLRRMADEMAELIRIAEAQPTWEEPSAEERKRVADGFKALRASLGSQKTDVTQESALDALRQRCLDNGITTDAIDALPDAPPRTGSFASIKRSEVAA